MTQTYKLAKSLLKGEAISILTGFQRFFITNVPREVGRSIERRFGVEIDKKQKNFKNADGESGYYFEYRLLFTKDNEPGIEKMRQYVSEIEGEQFKVAIKRGRKKIHVTTTEKNTEPKTAFKQSSLCFDTTTASWDESIE